MKGLEAKILSEWILNPWIFLNNTQNTLSIWTSIMNSELFWMGIASIVHTWPKNQWFPSLPFTSPEGSMSSPLSLNVKPVIRKQLCGFQGPCCVAAMIWSEFVFLLTQSLLHAITIMLNHREFINTVMRYCTWLLLQVLVILCSYSHFWIKKKINTCITGYIIKQFHPYNFLQSSTLLLITLEFV